MYPESGPRCVILTEVAVVPPRYDLMKREIGGPGREWTYTKQLVSVQIEKLAPIG